MNVKLKIKAFVLVISLFDLSSANLLLVHLCFEGNKCTLVRTEI